jgi:MOSC domain-containing protein
VNVEPANLTEMPSVVGRVAALWRYPVKSMLGEALSAIEVNQRGVVADRELAIRGADGKFGSGKNTRRFRRIDGLFGFRAYFEQGVPVIKFPDGRLVSAIDPEIHEMLSTVLGQPVTLAREAAISHFDQGPVHLVTSSSQDWLRARLPKSRIDARRFRPNILIQASGAAGLVEQSWIGRVLGLGKRVRVRVREPTERCVMITNEQDELPSDPGILRELAQVNDACFGVYAEVFDSGEVRLGDDVTILSQAL